MASYFEIRKIAIDTSSWTPVVPPIDCTAIDIQQTDGSNAIKVRTVAADPDTEKVIPNGSSLSLTAKPGSQAIPWPTGTTICYLQASAGTGPAVIEYVR